MSYFMQFSPILGSYNPLKSPLHYKKSTLKGSYSPESVHKLVLPENGYISIFYEVKMFEKYPKCHISCNFDQFWDLMTYSKAPYTTKKVLLRAHILSKVSINLYYQKMYSFLTFVAWKCTKCTQKSHNWSF